VGINQFPRRFTLHSYFNYLRDMLEELKESVDLFYTTGPRSTPELDLFDDAEMITIQNFTTVFFRSAESGAGTSSHILPMEYGRATGNWYILTGLC
jgi:hypothetical protein